MFIPSSISMVLPKALLDPVDESLWYPVVPTDLFAASDATADGINLGLQFSVAVPGDLHTICYYRVSGTMAASGTVALWQITDTIDDPTNEVLLAEVDFSGHSGTGWRVIELPDSVALTPANGYVAHVWFPSDGTTVVAPATLYTFLVSSRTSEPWGLLHASLDSGLLDPRGFGERNGLVNLGVFARPVDHFNGTNYWVDVIYNARPNPDPPQPPMVLKWPIPAGWPSAENTGPDPEITLTVVADPVTSTSIGQVIENIDARQGILINHSGVTVRNCKVMGKVHVVFIVEGTTGVTIQDCEIDGTGRNNLNSTGVMIGGTEVIIERCNIYRVENGTSCFGHAFDANIILRDCFIHHLRAGPGHPHYDGGQWDGGIVNVEITHNTIMNENLDTSCIMVDNYGGAIDNFLIQDNYICGSGYTCYADDRFNPVAYPITNVSYLRNLMHPGQYGYFLITTPETPIQEGNQLLGHGGIFDAPPPGGFVADQIVPEGIFPYARDGGGTILSEAIDEATGGLTVGVSFHIAQDGQITSVNFRRPIDSSTRDYKIGLWRFLGDNLASGVELLASQEFTNVTKSGLLNFAFAAPIDVASGDILLAGVFIPRGNDGFILFFADIAVFWPDPVTSQWGRMTAFSNNPATQPPGLSFGNGLFHYGPALTAPLTTGGSDADYAVHPIFVAPWEEP